MQGARVKRLMLWVLALIVLFGAAPLLFGLAASAIANAFTCGLDEGSVHPCIVLGHDIGELLYTMFVAIWFGMMTIPVAAVALIVWIVAAIVLTVIYRRRGVADAR